MPDPFGRIKRNMTEELIEGATDGGIKKSRPATSNRIADATDPARGTWSHVEGGNDWSPTDGDKRAVAHGYVRGA